MKFRPILLIIGLFAMVTWVSNAQPAVSRGEQRLPISFQESMNRAEAALLTEGYVNLYKQANLVGGYKGDVSAVITCNEATNSSYWINIFVASLTNNPGIPGGERVRLQQRMGQSGNVTGRASFVGNWNMGYGWGNLSIEQNGNQATGRYSDPPGGIWGKVIGNRMIVSYKNDNGKEGEAFFDLKPDGSIDGKWCSGKGCDPANGTYFKGAR